MMNSNTTYMSEEARFKEIRETNVTGMRLRELREERGYSLGYLAILLDNQYSSGALGKYERGERHPKRNCLKTLADFYGVDLNYLLGITHVRSRMGCNNSFKDSGVTPEEKILVKRFSACGEKEKELIFYTLHTFLKEGETQHV